MKARPLVLFCAIAMVASFFLPWLAGAIGSGTAPWDTFKTLDRSQIEDLLSNLPPSAMAFLASFALAALLVLLGLMGAAPRLIAIVTGAIPVGLAVWALYNASQPGGASGLPIPQGDFSQVIEQLVEVAGIGAWAWFGGGALLLLLGLFAPSRR